MATMVLQTCLSVTFIYTSPLLFLDVTEQLILTQANSYTNAWNIWNF